MKPLDAQTVETLASTRHYRDFLTVAIQKYSGKRTRLTYAALARNAGFRSRSFPRDVVLGKKNLSYESAIRFGQALGLGTDLREYFLMLVRGENLDSAKFARLRKRLLSKANEMKVGKQLGGFPFQTWLEIYAALGTSEQGADLEKIVARTRLPVKRVEASLKAMEGRGFLTFDSNSGHYLPSQAHLIFNEMGTDRDFKRWFLNTLSLAGRRAKARFDADDCLFFTSVFPVAQKDMPALRQELREVILRFVDSAENPHGDRLTRLQVSLFT